VIVVRCHNRWQLADLHSQILKKAGFELTQSKSKTTSGKAKVFARIQAKFFGTGTEGGAESELETSSHITAVPLELDPNDVNDVVSSLNSIRFSKHVVLEDFHYLPVQTQIDFSVSLKSFEEESGVCFIIIGVWLEENRLTVYNGDLTGRVVSINADTWDDEKLKLVIEKGASLLGINFKPDFVAQLLIKCAGSVYIVQEVCYRCCLYAGVEQTQRRPLTIGSSGLANELVIQVVSEQTPRFNEFISLFSDGFEDTALQLHKWILLPILISSPDKLRGGLTIKEMEKIILLYHPLSEELQFRHLKKALESAASLQALKGIKPIVLDYDRTAKRLRVVDSAFMIWLEHQKAIDILTLAGIKLYGPGKRGTSLD
jgi:hypothetical protein